MIIEIERSSVFKKSFKQRVKNSSKLCRRFSERVRVFQTNRSDPVLKDHSLMGSKKKYRSFSVTGDIRVVYYPVSKTKVLFVDVGSHNQVY